MPMTWIPPEVVLEYKDITVYETYKDGCHDSASENWFTTDEGEASDAEFDVREFSVYDDNKSIEENLRAAIDSGEITQY